LLFRGEKRLPLQLEDLLTPYALAVWFMDDGGQGGNSTYGLVIDVSIYTPPERAFLQQVLGRKYHLTTSLQHMVPDPLQSYLYGR
jgi:hypothetical protein